MLKQLMIFFLNNFLKYIKKSKLTKYDIDKCLIVECLEYL